MYVKGKIKEFGLVGWEKGSSDNVGKGYFESDRW